MLSSPERGTDSMDEEMFKKRLEELKKGNTELINELYDTQSKTGNPIEDAKEYMRELHKKEQKKRRKR